MKKKKKKDKNKNKKKGEGKRSLIRKAFGKGNIF